MTGKCINVLLTAFAGQQQNNNNRSEDRDFLCCIVWGTFGVVPSFDRLRCYFRRFRMLDAHPVKMRGRCNTWSCCSQKSLKVKFLNVIPLPCIILSRRHSVYVIVFPWLHQFGVNTNPMDTERYITFKSLLSLLQDTFELDAYYLNTFVFKGDTRCRRVKSLKDINNIFAWQRKVTTVQCDLIWPHIQYLILCLISSPKKKLWVISFFGTQQQ